VQDLFATHDALAVADLAVFLASERASYISGVVMTLDAGQAARH